MYLGLFFFHTPGTKFFARFLSSFSLCIGKKKMSKNFSPGVQKKNKPFFHFPFELVDVGDLQVIP